MSIYKRTLPTAFDRYFEERMKDAAFAGEYGASAPVPRCSVCGSGTRAAVTLTGHTAGSVWAALDEDRCPACRSELVLRDRMPLCYKCAIARRLLGLAPHVY